MCFFLKLKCSCIEIKDKVTIPHIAENLFHCCGEIQLKLVFKEDIEFEQKLRRKLPSGEVFLHIAGRHAWWYI